MGLVGSLIASRQLASFSCYISIFRASNTDAENRRLKKSLWRVNRQRLLRHGRE